MILFGGFSINNTFCWPFFTLPLSFFFFAAIFRLYFRQCKFCLRRTRNVCVCALCQSFDRPWHWGYCLTEELSGEQVSKSNKVEIQREGETEREEVETRLVYLGLYLLEKQHEFRLTSWLSICFLCGCDWLLYAKVVFGLIKHISGWNHFCLTVHFMTSCLWLETCLDHG